MMPLARRIYAEKRGVVVALGLGLLVNLAIYLVAVYPWTLKVRNDDARERAAASAARVAELNERRARATLQGKDQADAELRRFYSDVLPADASVARRVTNLRLAQLAQAANLRHERRSVKPERDKDSHLTRVRMTMVLAGTYRDIRRFIHDLETSPEFVVIEDVALAQGEEKSAPLVLTLQVSTYYWTGADGT
jgi:Tfp pilus assembly protein PilO